MAETQNFDKLNILKRRSINYDVKRIAFSTEYYLDMKDKLIKAGNEAEWMAKFQQAPYVREGILLPLDQLGYFNGVLPIGTLHDGKY